MLKPKVVIDTNVFVSAHLIPNGNPARVIDCWRESDYLLLVSKPIIKEIIKVLYEKGIDTKRIEKLLFLLSQKTILVTPKEEIFVIKNDPSDNKFLECAVFGKADILLRQFFCLEKKNQSRGLFPITKSMHWLKRKTRTDMMTGLIYG